MEKFAAHIYYRIGVYFGDIRGKFEALDRDQVVTGFSPANTENTKNKDGVGARKTIETIKKLCSKIGLTVSVRAADFLLESNTGDSTVGQFLDGFKQLERTIGWEMSERLFMFIPPDRKATYNNAELFGKEVNARFPSIQFDIVEAGNCYTAGRSTAVVFHLMRVMEIGVQEFGKVFGVSLVNEKNWQNILDEVNKTIKTFTPKIAKTVELSEVSANLYAVKLAWRNEVMHPNDTYTLEEADNLIRQVKIFMQNLAKVV